MPMIGSLTDAQRNIYLISPRSPWVGSNNRFNKVGQYKLLKSTGKASKWGQGKNPQTFTLSAGKWPRFSRPAFDSVHVPKPQKSRPRSSLKSAVEVTTDEGM